MNVDGHYSKLILFKAWKFWIHETSAHYELCRKTFTVSTMSHLSSKKHSNAAGQSSRGRMQLTSYYGKTMEQLWNFFSGDLYEPWMKMSLPCLTAMATVPSQTPWSLVAEITDVVFPIFNHAVRLTIVCCLFLPLPHFPSSFPIVLLFTSV